VPPGGSVPQPDEDVFVYRDTGGHPGDPGGAAALDAAESTAAYWYDLEEQDLAPEPLETRGPFEPLLSSSGPPPEMARRHPAEQEAAEPAGIRQAQAPADALRAEVAEETAHARARKLEQIKDFYLTAEAIGEQNVDKHFDQLLARQRELIGEYFRQSAAAQPAVAGPRDGLAAEATAARDPRDPRDPREASRPGMAGQGDPPGDAGVAVEPPRAW
jgi:hypothetical protein